MRENWKTWWGAAIVLAVAPGCFLFGGGGGPPPHEAAVAVGAEVTVVFEERCEDDPLSICVQRDAEVIDEVRLYGDAFELVSQRIDDTGRLLVTVRALAVGESDLIVDFQDFFEVHQHSEVRLQAMEITHVDLWVFCTDGPVQSTEGAFPISTGAEFPVGTQAMNGDTLLASGDMPLVADLAGFTVTDDLPGSYPRATAPTTPGTYTWTLVGQQARQVDFAIYNAADVDVALSEVMVNFDQPGVAISGVVGGEPVCIHGGETRVLLTTDGTCWPLVSSFEIAGPMPLLLGDGRVELALAGDGPCAVEAALDGDAPVGLTVAAGNPLPPPVPGDGMALAPTPVEVGGPERNEGSCDDALTDGDCDAGNPDGDCLVDSDWEITYHDGSSGSDSLIEGEPTGVGLTSELHLLVTLDFITIGLAEGPPVDLLVSVDPAGAGLGVSSPGCAGDDSRVVVLEPSVAGTYDLSIAASNIDDVGSFSVQARTVTTAVFSTDGANDEPPGGADVFYFVGSQAEVEVGYRSSGITVRGVAPIQVSASDGAAGSTISDDARDLDTGTAPHTITLASALAPQTQIVRVVDQTTILGVGDFAAEPMIVGGIDCVEPYPTTGGGRRIHGPAPARPRLSFTGDALTVEIPSWPDGTICFRGHTAGSTTVQVDWGAASVQQAWQVQ